MQLKDYYSILELSPAASLDEIKSAYRKLAHLYHPDKKGNDPYAAAFFAEIKEAYETLSNPTKKDIYLQQHWYAKSTNQKSNQEAITPVSVLKKMLELDKYVNKLDVHRMDKKGLHNYLLDIFSNETIEKLNAFNEPDMNASIVEAVLRSSRYLDWPEARSVSVQLLRLNTNQTIIQNTNKHIENARREYYWNKFSPWIMLLIVLVFCLVIILISD